MKLYQSRLFWLVIIVFVAIMMVIAIIQIETPKSAQEPALTTESKAENQRTLVFANWVSTEDEIKHLINKVISDFEKIHPHVDIVNLPIPFEYYEQELTILAMKGQAPDVMQLSGNDPAALGSMGVLEHLDAFAARDGYIDDIYLDSMIEAGKYEGQLFAVPFALTPHGFWYNKTLMHAAGLDRNQPPRTIEELNEHLRIISEKLPNVYGIGIDTTKINYAFIGNFPFFQAFGAWDLLKDPHDPRANSPEMVRALQWIQEVVRQEYTPVDMQIKLEREMMAHQEIVYKLDGPYFAGIAQSINPKLTDDLFDETFGVTVVPAAEGMEHATAMDIHSLGMSKKTSDKAFAWAFIQFLTSGDASMNHYILPMGMIPPLRSTHEAYRVRLSRPFQRAFIEDIIPTAKSMPFGPKFSQATQYVLSGLQEVIRFHSPEDTAHLINEALIQLYTDSDL